MTEETSDRFWETCVLQVLRKINKDYAPNEQDLATIAALYEKAEGTWEGLAAGDTGKWDLLRRCCRVYLKRKFSEDNDDGNG